MVSPLNMILVAVDYTDLLSITLPYNRHHFDKVVVVTDTKPDPTLDQLCEEQKCILYRTDSFYSDGAVFNKWKSLEEGLDLLGRNGWLCLMDADILWPKDIKWYGNGDWLEMDYPYSTIDHSNRTTSALKGKHLGIKIGHIMTPFRRMWHHFPHNPLPIRYTDKLVHTDLITVEQDPLYDDYIRFPSEEHWGEFPLHPQQTEFAGYSQIFHALDPVLRTCANCGQLKEDHEDKDLSIVTCRARELRFSWHQTNWKHAGGADSFFQARWNNTKKIRPLFQVLHLGEAGKNWCGRATSYADGSLPADSHTRLQQVRGFVAGRRNKAGEGRFNHERTSG